MKKILMILAVLVSCWGACPGAGLTPQQKQQVVARINSATKSMKTMTCGFVQTKHLAMLNDKMVSRGTMSYKQANRLRWEYTNPYSYTFILNGAKVYVGNKSRKDVIDTNRNKVFKEVARIMMSTVTGTALGNEADFSSDIADKGQQYVVTLVPKRKEMKNMFARIVLVFDKTNNMISEINIYEKNKDHTNIKLNNIRTNGTVNENVFAIPAK